LQPHQIWLEIFKSPVELKQLHIRVCAWDDRKFENGKISSINKDRRVSNK
jgi:hypothetical protein